LRGVFQRVIHLYRGAEFPGGSIEYKPPHQNQSWPLTLRLQKKIEPSTEPFLVVGGFVQERVMEKPGTREADVHEIRDENCHFNYSDNNQGVLQSSCSFHSVSFSFSRTIIRLLRIRYGTSVSCPYKTLFLCLKISLFYLTAPFDYAQGKLKIADFPAFLPALAFPPPNFVPVKPSRRPNFKFLFPYLFYF